MVGWSKEQRDAGVSREFVDELAALGVDSLFEKDTVIVREGELGEGLFVIRSGTVQVYSDSGDGRQVMPPVW